jgi:sugar lactone lactonase YvrE
MTSAGRAGLVAWGLAAACTSPSVPCLEQPGVLCVIAGTGEPALGELGRAARDTELYLPQDVARGADGQLLIVDWNNHRILSLDPEGHVQRLLGDGIAGDEPEGTVAEVSINHPTAAALAPDGTIVVAVWHNARLVALDPATGLVRRFGGTGVFGFAGDGGPAVEAELDLPVSVAFGEHGETYVADQNNLRVRMVDAAGNISTFAGSGAPGPVDGPPEVAQFDWPRGTSPPPGGRIARDGQGRLWVADSTGHRIRRIADDGHVSTIAGDGVARYAGDGGPAASASFARPSDVALADDGTVFVADTDNSCVRRIDADGFVDTVLGVCGAPGRGAEGRPAREAALEQPYGVEVDAEGTLYVADTHNHRIVAVRDP